MTKRSSWTIEVVLYSELPGPAKSRTLRLRALRPDITAATALLPPEYAPRLTGDDPQNQRPTRPFSCRGGAAPHNTASIPSPVSDAAPAYRQHERSAVCRYSTEDENLERRQRRAAAPEP